MYILLKLLNSVCNSHTWPSVRHAEFAAAVGMRGQEERHDVCWEGAQGGAGGCLGDPPLHYLILVTNLCKGSGSISISNILCFRISKDPPLSGWLTTIFQI